jgi:hypothetical protein
VIEWPHDPAVPSVEHHGPTFAGGVFGDVGYPQAVVAVRGEPAGHQIVIRTSDGSGRVSPRRRRRPYALQGLPLASGVPPALDQLDVETEPELGVHPG